MGCAGARRGLRHRRAGREHEDEAQAALQRLHLGDAVALRPKEDQVTILLI